MHDYISLGFRQKSLSQGIRSGTTQLHMLTLQRCDSVIFGGRSNQTSTSNFLSDLEPSPTAGSNFFLFLMPCPSVFLQLHQASCIFFLCCLIFSSMDCKSLEPTLMLLEHRMGGMSFLFLCRTARRMDLILVWIAYNHSLVLAPFFPSNFQPFFVFVGRQPC